MLLLILCTSVSGFETRAGKFERRSFLITVFIISQSLSYVLDRLSTGGLRDVSRFFIMSSLNHLLVCPLTLK